MAIATQEIEGLEDFNPDPDKTQVRLLRQGGGFDARWFVSFTELDGGEDPAIIVIEIDADDGKVLSIRQP